METTVILLCGGVGRRMKAVLPKQFLEVKGIPVIAYVVDELERAACIKGFVAVVHPDWKVQLEEILGSCKSRKCIGVVWGGETRLDSILKGTEFLEKRIRPEEYITILDGTRALVSKEILEDSVSAAQRYDMVFAEDKCFDTMYVSENGNDVVGVMDRDKLFKGQTPETAQLGEILQIIRQLKEERIEDMAIPTAMLKYGKRVGMSKGSVKNFKITVPEDLELFEALLNLNPNRFQMLSETFSKSRNQK